MRKIFLFIVTAVAILHVAYGQNRELQIFRGGSLVQSFNVATLDSVKVGYSLNAPVTVNAKLDGKSIAVSWTAVQGAVSYQVYRSSDANTAYKLLASDITGTGYKDSAPLDGANYYKVKAVGPGMQSQLSPTSAFIMFENDKSGTIDGHDYVDLGLPSGTLWATCNVGASKPEGYGNYYAWGETATKTVYDESTYKWGSYRLLNKYTGSSSAAELEQADDAAYVNWGKNWRMPSKAQFKELFNSSYTTTTWTSINGIDGSKITSKMPGYTGNSIFLPAARHYCGSSVNGAGSFGCYWSRTQSVNYSGRATGHALYLFFYSSNITTESDYRYIGQSIRPVRFSE